MKLGPAPEEGEGTREKRNQMADVSHATETKDGMCLRKPGGRRNRKKRPRNMGSAGKENLAVEAPEEAGVTVATVPEEKEARRVSEGT